MNRKNLLLLISLLCAGFPALAQGDLFITPKRVVFEGSQRKQLLNLVNVGTEITSYSVSFVQKDMTEDGGFVVVEGADSSHMFADPFLRIFPRKVTLNPGESQTIAVQCRYKADMADGEYRSHLYFRSEADYNPLGMENTMKDTTLLSVQLVPVYGISIPVIIRMGDVDVNTSLSDLELINLDDTSQELKLTINRSGNISVYGDLSAEFIPARGKSSVVGTVKGLGVYTNISKRNVSMKTNLTPGMNQMKGKLKIRYKSAEKSKKEVFAEAEFDL